MATANLRPLSNVLAIKATIELNESSKSVEYGLRDLRQWLLTQSHIRSRSSDQFLIVFLRAAKFNIERAKEKLENYYTYRATVPELFRNRNINDPKVQEIVMSGALVLLPDPVGADGPRVFMIRPSSFDMDKHTIPDVFKVGTMATDILFEDDDHAVVGGYVLVLDLANIPKPVYRSFDLSYVKKLTMLANKMSPARMKGFHFLNAAPFVEKVFNMAKSVISSKLRNRFYMHGRNYESLYQHIPREILPKEYGGTNDIITLQTEIWARLYPRRHILLEEENYGLVKEYSDDPVKKEKKNLQQENLGTFRSLNFD